MTSTDTQKLGQAETIAVELWTLPPSYSSGNPRPAGLVVREGDRRIEIPFDWITAFLDEILQAKFGPVFREAAVCEWIREGHLSGDWIASNLTHTRPAERHHEADERDKTRFGRFLVGLLGGIEAEPE